MLKTRCRGFSALLILRSQPRVGNQSAGSGIEERAAIGVCLLRVCRVCAARAELEMADASSF